MENKINLAEILKDCPKGTKLYSPLCGECKLYTVTCKSILVESTTFKTLHFYEDGTYYEGYDDAECLLFPSKENRDWSKFQRPFKDGDVLFHSDSASNGIFIFKEILQRGTLQKVICHCDYDSEDGFCLGENHTCCWTDSKILRPATKDQRDFLFQKIKEAGYKWNAETKTLEKLPKFKVGDRIKKKDIDDVYAVEIAKIVQSIYTFTNGNWQSVESVDREYELVPKKFDISTLKPFDKVLVRTKGFQDTWMATFFSHKDDYEFKPFWTTSCENYQQCIPYEGNEHLLGTTNDCAEYYKNW